MGKLQSSVMCDNVTNKKADGSQFFCHSQVTVASYCVPEALMNIQTIIYLAHSLAGVAELDCHIQQQCCRERGTLSFVHVFVLLSFFLHFPLLFVCLSSAPFLFQLTWLGPMLFCLYLSHSNHSFSSFRCILLIFHSQGFSFTVSHLLFLFRSME